IAGQFALGKQAGARGARLIADVDAYVAGINAYCKTNGLPVTPWKRDDVVAVATVLAARFGAGGGDELNRSMFRAALDKQLGPAKGQTVWSDLTELNDPEAPAEVPGSFPSGRRTATEPGAVAVSG